MVELKGDRLVFSFPEVHPAAVCEISFMRTLRIPDDDEIYPLPPGLGDFPLRHVDDFARNVPARWLEYGGVMLPMYQSEAMWLSFDSKEDERRDTSYPFAVKIATGKVDAVSGETWTPGLRPDPQNYVVVPEQPWLDGYCVQKGTIRQFVAMPLGQGYTAEEQITGRAEYGGLQIMVFPMKRAAYERLFPLVSEQPQVRFMRVMMGEADCKMVCGMGLAPGGQMRQEIYDDPYDLADWDTAHTSRCFVHIANSLVWRQITGRQPPTVPLTAAEYTRAGLPWFDLYDEARPAVPGSDTLAGMHSIATLGKLKRDVPLPENESVTPEHVVVLRRGMAKNQVREFVD